MSVNRKKSYIILVLIILCSIFLNLSYKSFSNGITLEKVKITKEDKMRFAIKIEDSNGDYVDYNEDTWPDSNTYIYNKKESGCIDEKGQTVENSLSFSNNIAKITTIKSVRCYLYYDEIRPALVLNNVTSANLLKYQQTSNCDNSTTGVWNSKYRRLEFENLGGRTVTCTMGASNGTSQGTLKSVVEANATDMTSEYGYVYDFSNATRLTQSQYVGVVQGYDYYPNPSSPSEAAEMFSFNSSLNQWEFKKNDYINGQNTAQNIIFKFYPQTGGGYRICYTLGIGDSELFPNYMINNNNAAVANSSSSTSGCFEVGTLITQAEDDGIYGANWLYYRPISPSTVSTLTFYVEKGTVSKSISLGYRYVGINPNNYIWFNNEMWRIVGEVPTCTSSGCSTSENLVKIVREEEIGRNKYHSSSSRPDWNSTSLYSILNSYYYGKGNTTCDFNCDYRIIGIDPNGFYGRMVKNVYWNTGNIDNQGSVSYNYETKDIFGFEIKNQTMLGKIGLLSFSDQLIAGEATGGTQYFGQNGWIYGKGTEYTLTTSNDNKMLCFHAFGVVRTCGIRDNNIIRPAVYLDSSVFVTGGNGTITNPYQISMN